MAKIIVVRHAESIANTQGIFQGQSFDTGLSSLGQKQANALTKRLMNEKIDRILTSPLKRTVITAKRIATLLKKEVRVEKNLIETNHGEWESRNRGWVEKYHLQILKSWEITPFETGFPGGEIFRETVERVKKFLHDTEWRGTSLLVTHDNIIRIMICLARKVDINKMWEFDLEPAAINIFEIEGVNGTKKINLVKLNDVEHLDKLRADITTHAL